MSLLFAWSFRAVTSAFFLNSAACAVCDVLWSARSFFVAVTTFGSMTKEIAPVLEISMCIVSSISPAAPLVIMTFSVSGVLQTAIMFGSSASSNTPISRIVQPPTSEGTTATTSIMFGDFSLTSTRFTFPRHFSPFRAVIVEFGL